MTQETSEATTVETDHDPGREPGREPGPDTVRVTAVQLAPVIGDLEGNVDRAQEALDAAVEAGARVVVLPELVTSGYVFQTPEEARSLAVTGGHELFAGWARAAARARGVVVGGFAEAGDDGLLYNSAALVDADGVRVVYRKVHLWDAEKHFFTPGSAPPPVWPTDFGTIGVMICFDLEFPEWPRTAALAGADLIAVPTNWPLAGRPVGERAPEVLIAMAQARMNKVAIACADRTGTERGVAWTAGTQVVSAEGWILDAVGEGTGSATADLDLSASRDKVIAPQVHLFDDRRPELYGALTATR